VHDPDPCRLNHRLGGWYGVLAAGGQAGHGGSVPSLKVDTPNIRR
jgi:hypothetical protein